MNKTGVAVLSACLLGFMVFVVGCATSDGQVSDVVTDIGEVDVLAADAGGDELGAGQDDLGSTDIAEVDDVACDVGIAGDVGMEDAVETDIGQEDSHAMDSSGDESGDVGVDAVETDVGEEEFEFDFTVVALPDTQAYSELNPDIYIAQTRWIVENAEKEKIVFVTHLGDVVEHGDTLTEWENARAAMDLLDEAGIPYGTCIGNHDRNATLAGSKIYHSGCSIQPEEPCSGSNYLDNFGPQRYADKEWFGGASPSALSNYQVFKAGGREFMFIHLAIDPWDEEVEWAKQVIEQYPSAAVAISTHRYLYDFKMTEDMPDPLPIIKAGRFNAFVVDAVENLYMENGWIADELFTRFIKINPQIYMVQCGHIDAEYYQASLNKNGIPVHEMLIDFQSIPPDGGNGYMRLLRYDLKNGRIRAQTWSPTLERFRVNGEGCDFSLELVVEYAHEFDEYIKDFPEYADLQELLEYWITTEEGRAEFCAYQYDDGQRDSDFVFEVDILKK